MMDLAFFITAFTTLFVVIDPFGTTPIFVALTQGMDSRARRKVALRTCATASGILIAFAAFGEAVLGFVGISMEAFKVAGGALLFLTALDMLFERRTKRREDRVEEGRRTPRPVRIPSGHSAGGRTGFNCDDHPAGRSAPRHSGHSRGYSSDAGSDGRGSDLLPVGGPDRAHSGQDGSERVDPVAGDASSRTVGSVHLGRPQGLWFRVVNPHIPYNELVRVKVWSATILDVWYIWSCLARRWCFGLSRKTANL